ncbi:hypothetical protein, partial [Escherichia coli]
AIFSFFIFLILQAKAFRRQIISFAANAFTKIKVCENPVMPKGINCVRCFIYIGCAWPKLKMYCVSFPLSEKKTLSPECGE